MKFGLILLASSAMAWPFQNLHVLELEEGKTITVRESEKWALKRKGLNFMDITKFPKLFGSKKEDVEVPVYEYPKKTQNKETVESLTKNIDKQSMHDNLAKFSSFFTRYYKSETGYESALWLSEKLANITKPLEEEIIIQHVDHKDWKQFSIIVSLRGQTTPENIIVMGAHQDSINLLLPSLLAAPGADDDGSGTVTNLEALRIYIDYLNSTGYRPDNTIEFHFYSAEEGGLLGSLDVFSQYAEADKKVVAMLQQDMTGYVPDADSEHVGVITDYTTPGLTDFVKLIIDDNLSIPYVETECGYACSDHGSATKNGYPGAFVIESSFKQTNKYIHSTMDTLDRLSFDHMAEHVKLVVGSLIELGTWDFPLIEMEAKL